jgi:hypothetical protein
VQTSDVQNRECKQVMCKTPPLRVASVVAGGFSAVCSCTTCGTTTRDCVVVAAGGATIQMTTTRDCVVVVGGTFFADAAVLAPFRESLCSWGDLSTVTTVLKVIHPVWE